MTGLSSLDVERLFAAVPSASLLLDPALTVVDANPAYCALLGRRRVDLAGRSVFALFPDNPDDAGADGVKAVRASLEAARDTGRVQTMPLQRYDIATTEGGMFVRRYWSIVNAPTSTRASNGSGPVPGCSWTVSSSRSATS